QGGQNRWMPGLCKRLSEKGSDPLPSRMQIPQTESKSLQKSGGLTPFRIASKWSQAKAGATTYYDETKMPSRPRLCEGELNIRVAGAFQAQCFSRVIWWKHLFNGS